MVNKSCLIYRQPSTALKKITCQLGYGRSHHTTRASLDHQDQSQDLYNVIDNYHELVCHRPIMPGFHHSVAVLPLPFRRSAVGKIPLFCKNYVRKFRSVTAVISVNSKKIRNGSGNGNAVRKRQRLTGTSKRQRNDGNRT